MQIKVKNSATLPYTFKEIIQTIRPKERKVVLRIIHENKDKFLTAPGGLHKHQNWPGGYKDHVFEIMNIAFMIYNALSQRRKLPFTLSDALYMLFLHDLEKMFYLGIKGRKPVKLQKPNMSSVEQSLAILDSYKVKLTPAQKNALTYTHGEGKDYHPTKRIMGPLAAFVHRCDTMSARIWYKYPKRRAVFDIDLKTIK
jgi:hypothetical protein